MCGSGFVSKEKAALNLFVDTSQYKAPKDTLSTYAYISHQIKHIRKLGHAGTGMIAAGMLLSGCGTLLASLDTDASDYAVRRTAGITLSITGSIFTLTGITQRLVYQTKKNDLQLKLLANQYGVGVSFYY